VRAPVLVRGGKQIVMKKGEFSIPYKYRTNEREEKEPAKIRDITGLLKVFNLQHPIHHPPCKVLLAGRAVHHKDVQPVNLIQFVRHL
jgi:hypothetical protein